MQETAYPTNYTMTNERHIRIFHSMWCLYTAIRGDNVSFQSSRPDNMRSFSNICKLRWKSFTLSWPMIFFGIRLYTQIRPRALRRSIYRKRVFLMSTICLLRLMLALRVLLLCCDDAANPKHETLRPLFKRATINDPKTLRYRACTTKAPTLFVLKPFDPHRLAQPNQRNCGRMNRTGKTHVSVCIYMYI